MPHFYQREKERETFTPSHRGTRKGSETACRLIFIRGAADLFWDVPKLNWWFLVLQMLQQRQKGVGKEGKYEESNLKETKHFIYFIPGRACPIKVTVICPQNSPLLKNTLSHYECWIMVFQHCTQKKIVCLYFSMDINRLQHSHCLCKQ